MEAGNIVHLSRSEVSRIVDCLKRYEAVGVRLHEAGFRQDDLTDFYGLSPSAVIAMLERAAPGISEETEAEVGASQDQRVAK